MRDRRRPLAVVDLPWLLTDTVRHPMHVAGLIVCRAPEHSGSQFIADLVTDLRAEHPVVDPFDRRVDRRGRGRVWPRWTTVAEIDTDERVRHVVLPTPGGQAELEALVAVLHRQRLDLTAPLWQIHVIEGLASNRFAIYAKFHHSLVDGVGAVRLLEAALSTDPDERGVPPVWAGGRGGARRFRSARRRRPGAVRLGLRAAARNAANRQATRPYSAPTSMLNTTVSADRRVSMRSLDVARLRHLATAMDATVNDVYLSMCAAALRRYLLEHDALPSRPLVAAVPVSVRPLDDSETGNAITFAFTTLATDVADDRERSARITADMAAAKARLAEIGSDAMNAYTVATMAPFIAGQLAGVGARTRPMFNLAVSNLPGPGRALFYNGSSVEAIHPVSVLQAGQPLNITALSYLGQLHLTITACGAYLPDIETLAGYVVDALTDLEGQVAPTSTGQ